MAVGAGAYAATLGWTPVTWSLDSQSDWLSRAAVGVMPQTRDAWADRKQGYKLYEYIAYGAVPVASDVPCARLVLGSERLYRCLLVSEVNEWLGMIERAADRRTELLPYLRGSLRRSSVD